MILVDEADEVWILNYRKHIISYRPYLSQLPIKFNDVARVETMEVEYQMNFSRAK